MLRKSRDKHTVMSDGNAGYMTMNAATIISYQYSYNGHAMVCIVTLLTNTWRGDKHRWQTFPTDIQR